MRDGEQVELVALYWTVSGPVEVHVGREWSLFDWADRCAEARKVGFSGLGIWHADLEHVLETRSLQEMKQAFDDNGLRHLEVECLLDWFLDPGDELRRASDRTRALLFEAAGVLGAHHVKVANIFAREASLAQLTERFGELCADAANHTDAKIVYELMPPDVNVHTIDARARGRRRRRRVRTAVSRSTRGTCRSSGSRRTSSAASRSSTWHGSSSPTGRSRTWTTRSTR